MQIEHSNEIDLVRQTLAGDTSAFDRLVKTHRSTVYVVVISYIKNPADAEDLTQTDIYSGLRAAGNFTPVGSLSTVDSTDRT